MPCSCYFVYEGLKLFNSLAFRLVLVAIISLLLTTVFAIFISLDEVDHLEVESMVDVQGSRIRETLDLLNELHIGERPIVLRKLKKGSLYFVTGLTYFLFPPIFPIDADHPARLIMPQLIEKIRPFKVLFVGRSHLPVYDTRSQQAPEVISLVVQLHDYSYVWIGMHENFFKVRRHIPFVWPILLIVLPLAMVISMTLYWVLRPLRQLSRAAASIGQSVHQQPHFPTLGLNEIVIAGRALKSMHQSIKRQFNRLMIALGALSHDLRTPLQRLQLRVEMIDDESLREALHHDLEELHQRVEDGLFYLRGEGRVPEKSIIAFAQKLEELVKSYQHTHQQLEFEWSPSISLDDKRWAINGHWSSLHRAIANLIDNALSYSDWVCVTLSLDHQMVLLTIRDHGPGIPENQLERVCEPFVRLDSSPCSDQSSTASHHELSSKKKRSGSGLGLSIALGIIEQHLGTLVLANHPEGGLIVTIRLPALVFESMRNASKGERKKI